MNAPFREIEPLGVIRASSWPSLFDCSFRWYWQNIVGLRMPSSGAAALGTAIHHGTAVFDAARIAGDPVPVDEAVEQSVSLIDDPQQEVDWGSLDQRDARHFAVMLTARYCQEIAPTRHYLAVELACDALDISTEFGVVRVTGTTDRIRQIDDGREGISDIKSGGRSTGVDEDGERIAITKGHQLQLGIYTLMSEQSLQRRLDAPAEIIGLQASKSAPVATGEIADVKTPLLGTDEHPGLIEIAARMLKSGVFPPNPKSMLCSRKFCPAHAERCPYHD